MKTTTDPFATFSQNDPHGKGYLPINDEERLAWLGNFSTKIGKYSSQLNISGAEIDAIALWYKMFKYVLELIDETEFFVQDLLTFKEHIMFAPVGSIQGPMPYLPIATPPSIITAGIFTLINAIVKRIKSNHHYTEAIGRDLGIIGSEM